MMRGYYRLLCPSRPYPTPQRPHRRKCNVTESVRKGTRCLLRYPLCLVIGGPRGLLMFARALCAIHRLVGPPGEVVCETGIDPSILSREPPALGPAAPSFQNARRGRYCTGTGGSIPC